MRLVLRYLRMLAAFAAVMGSAALLVVVAYASCWAAGYGLGYWHEGPWQMLVYDRLPWPLGIASLGVTLLLLVLVCVLVEELD